MPKRRRRSVTSDWIQSLQQYRRSRYLRQDLRSPLTYRHVAETDNLSSCDAPNVSDAQAEDIGVPDIDPTSRNSPQSYNHDESIVLLEYDTSDDEAAGTEDSILSSAGDENELELGETDAMDLPTADVPLLEHRRKKWENRHVLSAMVAVVGSVRFTVKQYEYTRTVLKTVTPDNTEVWPAYSKIQRCFKTILTTSMPRSSIVNLPKKGHIPRNEQEANVDEQGERVNPNTSPVRIFYPTAWAQLDVSTSRMFADKSTTIPSSGACLENSQIVKCRAAVTDANRHLYVEHNGATVECYPGAVISVSAQSSPPDCDTPFNLFQAEDHYSFHGTVSASWVVGTSPSRTQSWSESMTMARLTIREKKILRCLATAESRYQDSQHSERPVLPGDLCTLLRAEQDSRSHEYVPVIIHRFWRYETGIPSVLLSWVHPIPSTSGESTDGVERNDFHIVETHVVNELRLRRQSADLPQCDTQNWKGTLADGTRYVIYRILLYCDDFQKSTYSGSSGSAGGCYFMPLAIPPEERRKTSSVRLISLTPPGVSTNEVLRYTIPDLVKGTVSGVKGVNLDGEEVRIFLDVVGFIGDYPASSGAIDVIGHVGRAPCTLCTFRRPKATEVSGSRYGYTTEVHANNSTFVRNAERHNSLRDSNISEQDANILGMVGRDRVDDSPLIHFHNELLKQRRNALQIPLTTAGTNVVTGKFDPYRCNLVAPDHLLTGLSKDILNTLFSSLPSNDIRKQVDVSICAALRDNGLLSQKEVYNWRTHAIHSMTLSEVFCVLLVVVPILKIWATQFPEDDSIHEVIQLLNKFHRIVRLTYWWPRKSLDGIRADDYIHRCTNNYFSELKRLSKEYVRSVDAFCCSSPSGASLLDKPNLHRLLELYEHTLPAFGHVREFMELIFESVHQPLKRSISNSNNHDAHIFAMEQCVGNDWQGRLASLSREITHVDSIRRMQGRRALRRLLLGAETDALDDVTHEAFISETDPKLEDLFTTAVKQQFNDNNLTSNFDRRTSQIWKPTGVVTANVMSRNCSITKRALQDIITTAVRWIDTLYPPNNLESNSEWPKMRLFKRCKRIKVGESGRQIAGVNGFDRLSTNCVVQIQMSPHKKRNKVIKYEQCETTIPVFFIFIAALHREEDLTWALCLRCSVHGQHVQTLTGLNKDTFQILCLTDEVRRVAVYHVCQDANSSSGCEIDTETRTIHHTATPLEGAKMYVQRRIDGYPPRVA